MGPAQRGPYGPGKRLTHDERLRAELELCETYRIPHSQYLGLGDGRWTARDREKALAYRAYQRTVCAQCGTRYEDWDHGHDDEDDAYAVTVQRCVGCQVLADKQDELQKTDTDMHGLKLALIPVAVHAALETEREMKRAGRRRHEDDEDE
ncbi:hypothetical protein [Streptomyces sp. NBC_01353]|uniref:hypothetical protein n=1 Tax=Streptomyces sp. NBC_01353 TaxID=2903835 RepID=UPI002E35222D|nr:hypothetical protein [Streptomyces sp. NBC_01353]